VVQQALPGAATAIAGPGGAGGTAFGPFAYAQPINYNENPGGDVAATIQQFFASNTPVPSPVLPAGCPAVGCGDQTGTAPGFTAVTLYEFAFQTTGESFTVLHDDGVSLFLAGTEGTCTGDGMGGTTGCGNDLLPTTSSAPTAAEMDGPVTLAGGCTGAGTTCTYDLWYTSANGTPEVLQTGTVVPAPLIGHGFFVLLAVGGVLFGGKFLEGLKKRHLHAA
jgi:hypothetical protein